MTAHVLDSYKAGVNLGGWISQCKDNNYAPEHIAEFIREADIRQIASWGADHVRLPFDYPVLESDDKPFEYIEAGFAVIDELLAWCKKYGLNVVLDMHKAPGYVFNENIMKDKDVIELFVDETMQKRFISLWEYFTRRYINERGNVIFELLNEITNPHGDSWNKLARKTIEAVQAIDPDRYILLGGPYFNAARGLSELDIYDDEHILYNFHFYDPQVFTHQRARWMRFKDTDIHQVYPGRIEGWDVLTEVYPGQLGMFESRDELLDKDLLVKCLKPAFDFMAQTGKRLYCGEFGAIELADMDSRVNWLSDIADIFIEHRISRAVWTYKGMDFTSIDADNKPASDALIKEIVRV